MQPLPGGLPGFGLQAPPSAGFPQAPAATVWDAGGLIGLGEAVGSAGTLASASTLTASGGVGVGSTNADGFQDLAAAWGLGAPHSGPATAGFDPLGLDLDDLGALELELAGQNSGASGAAPASAGTGTTTTTAGPDGSSAGAATDATGSATGAEEKKERQRAQNRAKQARFRQRQKEKREEMEAKVDAAEADLERERQLNHSIRQTGAALEAVKISKDIAVAVLEAAGGSGQGAKQQRAALPAPDGAPASAASGACAAVPEPDCGCTLIGCDGVDASSASGALNPTAMWELPFQERVQLCCSIFCASESAQRALVLRAGCNADGFALDRDTRSSISENLVSDHPQMLEAVMRMSSDDVLEDWAEFGEFAAGIVAAVDSGEITEEEAERRMQPAVMYQAILHTLLMKHRPEYEQRLLAYTTHPGESEEQATARWRQVALAMGVTAEQAKGMLPHYLAYCQRMRDLGDDAASALATLQELQQLLGAAVCTCSPHFDLSLRCWYLPVHCSSMVQQYLDLAEATGALTAQPKAALLILEDFFCTAGAFVTLLQKARMTAACRPLHPDGPAIAREGLILRKLLPPDAREARLPAAPL
ncbi:hypothetical protein ABPG75_006011 [Micractinium tetrahymenae]